MAGQSARHISGVHRRIGEAIFDIPRGGELHGDGVGWPAADNAGVGVR